MGEVYRARDTRLERTVAVKVLPVEFASEPTLRARFEREARAVSALEHPHICTLHDVGEQDGLAYLVMEHLEGETLAERLKKGPLPLAQALKVGTQMADALAAAHKHGIVHRDLKPGNVMLTKTGVKLLDFGLARLTPAGQQPIVADLASTPTEAAPLTGQRTILGTLPYMAPEQLEGKPADARTDLWALGVILYEMVTGRRAFEGASQVSLIGAILEREPAPLATLQPLTPPSLERLVKRCLAKSPEDRWDTAHDVADELRWIAQVGLAPPPWAAAGRRPRWTWFLGATGLVAAGVIVGVFVAGARRSPRSPLLGIVRSLLDVGPAEEVNSGGIGVPGVHFRTQGGSRTALAWTPDGRAIVFVGIRGGVRQLYVRELDRGEARSIPGTEGAQVLAVSPDGQWVAFWADEALRKVPLGGGAVALLAGGIGLPSGMAWGGGGELFYDGGESRVIWRVSAEHAPTVVTKRLEGEISHVLPTLLPGERVLLYTARKRLRTWGDEEITAQVLTSGERKTLLRDAVDARYVPSRHLVFLRRGTLFAVPFDPARLEIRGGPVALVADVSQALTAGRSDNMTGAGQFSVASTGTLAYVAGPVLPHTAWSLVAINRRGQVAPLPAPVRTYGGSTLISPDGRRLAVNTEDLVETAVWLQDLVRGTTNKLTPEGEAMFPRWTPDGQRVAFLWLNRGRHQLAWQRADGTAPPEVLLGDFFGDPSSWSPDGRHLTLVKEDEGRVWVATVEGSKASVEQITRSSNEELWPTFSPDGRWLAYGSNESGRFEVYVQPWPGPGPREQVSLDGGESPAWNPAGREIFFLTPLVSGKRRMMVAPVSTSPRLSLGTPRPLFEFSFPELRLACVPVRCYSVASDGEHFYSVRWQPAAPPPPATTIQLVLNWTEELKARVPAGPTR
jgi:serine/threonine-protein kinase